jgi:predicted nucleic acid-binding protein
VKPAKIAKHYVVDSSVAAFGCIEPSFFAPEIRSVANASVSFLSRASYHGAELHVPSVFFSEVMNFVYRFTVGNGLVSLEDGKQILAGAFGTNWEIHFPIWDSVFEVQHKLKDRQTTTDSEFLALAADLNYTFITTDSQLVLDAREAKLRSKVLLVTDHLWAQSGGVDEFPIDP